jgi:hypothetical protein
LIKEKKLSQKLSSSVNKYIVPFFMDTNISNEQIFKDAKTELNSYMDSKTDEGVGGWTFLYDVRAFTKSKTRLWAEDNELTYTEVVWKTFYNQIDKQIAEKMNPDKKKEFDAQVESLDSLKFFQSQSPVLKKICDEVEEMIPTQIGFIGGMFDNSDNKNQYVIRRDEMFNFVIRDKKISNSERVKHAQEALKFIDNYCSKILKQIQLLNTEIKFKLVDFEKELEPLAKADNPKINHIISAFREWLKLTKELSDRTFILSYVNFVRAEADKDLMAGVIKDEGDVNKKQDIDEGKNNVKIYGSSHLLFLENEPIINKIIKNKEPILEKLKNFFSE